MSLARRSTRACKAIADDSGMSALSSIAGMLPLILILGGGIVLFNLVMTGIDGGTNAAGLFERRLLVRRKNFVTRVEAQTLLYIEELFPKVRVHCQVAMSALIAPAKGLSSKERLWTHRRYGQKVVDFVLQDRASGKIIVLVELDDRTHNEAKDRERDKITAAGGYPTIRLTAKMRPTRASVAAALKPVLGI
ncbi:MAG: DUF2726 domain-containing protein [Parasphingorhabdus sp.]|jgi:hypothetical protein|uniref:DUF2726 domain-containing protein n=1 Tax=Parasphingorhabdus sp. TaxID=2709688 RepID=UPI003002E4C5|tara:strand:+ start:10121 stop:10696 length:576 start_codon:yes stop_codon:yes gene_type:complete